MQWHRDGARCLVQQIAAGLAQQFTERRGERPPWVVFEGVNDFAQSAVVLACGSRGVNDAWRTAPARRAHRPRRIEDTPRRQHAPTLATERWTEPLDTGPAQGAYRTTHRIVQDATASRAFGREDDRQQRVSRPDEAVRGVTPREIRDARRCPRVARARRRRGTHG